MGARRKQDGPADASTAVPAPPRGREGAAPLALAGAGSGFGASSPVHDHIARLEASFSAQAEPPPFSPAVRIAIMVGAPTLLWGLVIMGVSAVARAVGT